jgi:hypothetical protein
MWRGAARIGLLFLLKLLSCAARHPAATRAEGSIYIETIMPVESLKLEIDAMTRVQE